jgi:hypothetical protein
VSDEELQTMLQAFALTGIPAATLAGLRDGSLVAVPRDKLVALATPKSASRVVNPWTEIARMNEAAEAILAAAARRARAEAGHE